MYEKLPEMNTPIGYFVYSLIAYLFILFTSWLVNPTVEKAREDQ
jgi:hypothetical protein